MGLLKNMPASGNGEGRNQLSIMNFISVDWSNQWRGVWRPQQSLWLFTTCFKHPHYKTESHISFSVYLVNRQVSDTFWCQKYIYTLHKSFFSHFKQLAWTVLGQLTVRDVHKMNEISANSNIYPDSHRPRVDVLISARGIKSSENWMR